jgi:hypothetical protein
MFVNISFHVEEGEGEEVVEETPDIKKDDLEDEEGIKRNQNKKNRILK